ncbi:hypothetical protein [uncultured Bacteroides sp.]|uniref:hypothetical protein n=1 Tax=uncultured Bacteroides sp. TaxID=162156 RepID=UPI002625C8B9|nr:hypothetical protein [uncultured Bacteroides sp.]
MINKICSILLFLTMLCCFTSMQGKDKDNKSLSYEIKCAGTGQQGFYLVEVTAYAQKKNQINIDLVKKCAVHGVIFSGFSGEQGCKSQKAMLNATQEQQHVDFFNAFFENDYLHFASAVDPTLSIMKVEKRYAVTATIQVAKDNLRETLEKAGILRKLGF